jgi:elongation factor P--(R)-beta-lysine ligase
MNAALRSFFEAREYLEVETPLMVPAPGMEPHIRAFETELDLSELGRPPRRLYLHTSPEYAMKRLLAGGLHRIYQLCKVFRNEPPSFSHNPEFTMLELYRAPGDHEAVMGDLEALLEALCRAFTGSDVLPGGVRVETPFPRVRVRDAFREATGVDIADHPPPDPASLAAALEASCGIEAAKGDGWDEVFFRAFLDRVEPKLGADRATFLVDYPAHMAALARLREDDPRWAARFELFIGGTELANGFFELNDAGEQRARLEDEQAERRRLGRPVYPLDEDFLEAVGRMPEAGGVAVGMDRVLMLLTGASSIEEVLLFPAHPWV